MQYVEGTRFCNLCGGTGEHRFLGRHYLGDTSDKSRSGGVEPCPRCNATGREVVIIVVSGLARATRQ